MNTHAELEQIAAIGQSLTEAEAIPVIGNRGAYIVNGPLDKWQETRLVRAAVSQGVAPLRIGDYFFDARISSLQIDCVGVNTLAGAGPDRPLAQQITLYPG